MKNNSNELKDELLLRKAEFNRLQKILLEKNREAINIGLKFAENCRKNNFKFKQLSNLTLYSSLINNDLQIILGKIRISHDKYERSFYARMLSMTIIEYLYDINHLFAYELVNELKENNMENFIDEIKSINRDYSNFKKNNENILKEIRNNASAHKIKDSIVLYYFIENLNVQNIYDIGFQLGTIMNNQLNVTTKIANEIIFRLENGTFE